MSVDGGFSPAQITLIDNSKYEAALNPIFIVLGMLDEYIYRMDIYGAAHVERFYPGEKPLIEVFVHYLTQAAEQQNLPGDISAVTGEKGHIQIRSFALSRYIRSLYGENYYRSFYDDVVFRDTEGNDFTTRTYGIAENMFPAFSNKWAVSYERDRAAVDARLSYLLGAHIRYGMDYSFKLANAPHKVDLMIDFLTRMGVRRITKSWTVNTGPIVTEISFEPNDDLARIFTTGLAEIQILREKQV